ncbi:MerR family DNA-binding transcriptional regulator, partial [Pseudomonas aeruginosa]|nr:MerR family DNA-binding transcriptional regulator [Pseudomonas aeruginosa]
MMRIGELGKKADCLVQTVRFYESEGLLPSLRAGSG